MATGKRNVQQQKLNKRTANQQRIKPINNQWEQP